MEDPLAATPTRCPTLSELRELLKNFVLSLDDKPQSRELLDHPENGTIAEEFPCLLCLSELFQPVTVPLFKFLLLFFHINILPPPSLLW